MKFLDNFPELELLSKALSFSSSSLRVTTRLEALSCKSLSRERKLLKVLEQDIASDIELSHSISPPDGSSQLDSVFGPLDRKASRKTLWLLISTLNAAYPDFDFSSVRAEEFAREPNAQAVLSSLSNALNTLRASSSAQVSVYRSFSSSIPAAIMENGKPDEESMGPTHPILRQVLDPIIGLNDCEIYSYSPDMESDPHAVESETTSVAATEDRETEDSMFPMDGFPGSAPSTPGGRRLRSGKTYWTPQTGRPRPQASRSRSGTPSRFEEDTTGGPLWSRLFFFYNKQKKRILFISHHAKRLAPSGTENMPPRANLVSAVSNWAEASNHKRRASSISLASPFLEDAPVFKRIKAF